MKRLEFEKKIKELKLEKVYREGKLQTYSNEKREFYRDSARDNLYGCYYNEKTKYYIIFFTDAERDVVVELGHFSTEEEAYEKLFETIKKWDEDYKNNK